MKYTIFEGQTKPQGRNYDTSLDGLQRFLENNIKAFSKKSELNQISLFQYSNNYRSGKTAISASGIIFDVDNEEKLKPGASRNENAPPIKADPYLSIDDAIDAIEMISCSALIYTTPSHKDDFNKFRIIVPTSREMSPDEIEECADFFLSSSGLSLYSTAIDKCYKIPSQAYYLPARRLGSKEAPFIKSIHGNPFKLPKLTESKKVADIIIKANADLVIEDDWWKEFDGDLSTLDILSLMDIKGLRYGKQQPSGAIPCDCPFNATHKMKAFIILPGHGKGSGKWPIVRCSTERCSGHGLKEFLLSCGVHTVDSYCAKKWQIDKSRARVPADISKLNNPADLKSDVKSNDYKIHTADLAAIINNKHSIIRSESGDIFEYDGAIWRKIDIKRIQSYAQAYDSYYHTTRARRGEATDFLLNMVHKSHINWNKLDHGDVAFKNGVYNLLKDDIKPHSPDMFLDTMIPHDFTVGNVKFPIWMKAMQDWFSGEYMEEKIASLQEYFGYVLMQEAKYKKALIMYGRPDSGKSLALQILKYIVGPDNTCHIAIDKMSDPRDLAHIFGKKLNALFEVGSDTKINEGGFKQLVSCEDSIQIRFLWAEAMSYTPTCKHVICGNTLPEFNDKSGAILNRILIIKFNNQISRRKQDPSLFIKFVSEINGIIGWALEGARRLIKNNGIFTECLESESTKEDYGNNQNIMYDFIEDNYETTFDDNDCIMFEQMYSEFLKFMKRPLDRNSLARCLFDLNIRTEKKRMNGYRCRWVLGVKKIKRSIDDDKSEMVDSYSSDKFFGRI